MLDPEYPNKGIEDSLIEPEAGDHVDDELATTAAVFARLREVEPNDGIRKELKEAYLARVANPAGKPRFLGARRVAALAAAILLSSGGAVYAANDAMPDSALYPVKRAAESAALSVTSGEIRSHLEDVFARKRLREAGYLLDKKVKAVERSAAIELLEEAREEGDRGLKNKVDELLERVGQGDGSRSEPKEKRENPSQGRAKEAPGRFKEKPASARDR